MARGQRVLANGDVFVHMPTTDEHRKDGSIGERNSYGNDPFAPRG